MAEARIQVLGLTRFSFPAELEGFQTRHETMEERRAALYAPARMETRLFWFEHIALPGLRAQTQADFTLLLLIGDDMPAEYRTRLEAMIADVPQIRVVARPSGPHRLVYREILRAARDPDADMVAEFRLDDDDAVAVNYVQMIRRMVPQLRGLFRAKGRLALDQGKGVVIGADGAAVSLTPVLSHCWAAALTVFLRPEDDACVMDFPHQKVWHRMPLVSQTDQLMFLRGAHGTNDSKVGFGGTGRFKLKDADAPELLQRRFAVDIHAFRAGWASLMQRL